MRATEILNWGCFAGRAPAETAPPVEPAPYVDTRPSVAYRLPDGTEVAITHHHGDRIAPTVSFGLKDGSTVWARLVDQSRAFSVACDCCGRRQ